MRMNESRRCLRLGVALLAAWPMLASALTRCPHESEKGVVFWALGFAVFGVFVLLGLAAPFAAIRLTRGRRTRRRVLWTLAACVPMLGAWLLGMAIFFTTFVLSC